MPLVTVPDLAAPLAEWAQWYAAQGWPVFPCHSPTATGCSCHKEDCDNIGKHPRTQHGLKDASTDITTIHRWWRQFPTANIGLVTGLVSGLVVLDEDSYKGGDVSRIELEQTYHALPETVQQLTGGGGVQYFFAHPGTPIRNGVDKLGIGLDIRGDGGYVIVPPSLHVSGKQYIWEVVHQPDECPLAPFPEWLNALCHATARADATSAGDPIPNHRRNDTLFRLGCAMRSRGFSAAVIGAALREMNATQCQPPLDDGEVQTIATSCAKYAPTPPRDPAPGWSVNGVNGTTITAGIGAAWRKELFAKKNGELTQNVFNISTILDCHERWQQPEHALWWDTVRGRPLSGESELTDDLLMEMATWLGREERLPITSPRLLEQCVLAQCKKHPRDLLQLWLNSLEGWDGTPRLSTWLTDIGGAPPTEYTANISRGLLVSMVARAMHPGCHYRFVVIFEGVEELGKSSLVRELASPEWYVELSIGLETKEAHMMLQGVWVAEFSELDSLSRTEETRLKAFITMREDSFIPKYSNFRQRTERRAIFIGTTNEESYLKGQSGNTRYVPIRLTQQIDLVRFRTMRAQLFAEALHYYHAHHEDWWQFSDEALETAKDERDQRRVMQIYEDPLDEWLEIGRFAEVIYDNGIAVVFRHGETSWPEIARWFLRLDTPEKWKDRSLQMQIAATLKALGWHVSQIWKNGRNRKIWQKDVGDVPF